jgi:hypothetical protein
MDYVREHLYQQYMNGMKSIMCCHGQLFNPEQGLRGVVYPEKRWYYWLAQSETERMLTGGTATMSIPLDLLTIPADPKFRNAVDVYVAGEAARRDLPILSFPREADWMCSRPSGGPELWKQRSRAQYDPLFETYGTDLRKVYRKLKGK